MEINKPGRLGDLLLLAVARALLALLRSHMRTHLDLNPNRQLLTSIEVPTRKLETALANFENATAYRVASGGN